LSTIGIILKKTTKKMFMSGLACLRKFVNRTTLFGHTPKAVTVVLSEDTLVITLHEALSPAERALAATTEGAAQIQEFHRQLFAASSKTFRQEIQRITGREVRVATAEVVPSTGVIVHAFATGTVVQVFLLENENKSKIASESGSDSLTEQGF
jgi:uncharacterized protein YbcI